jgi:hypothetical protein
LFASYRNSSLLPADAFCGDGVAKENCPSILHES